MAKYVNKGEGGFARVIHVGGVMLVPGVETEIPDNVAGRVKGFKALLDSGVVEPVKGDAKTAAADAKRS
ncbi:hypothetical protein HMPREF9946_03138 [Acetobacteraceae bacterium AT-5844]|nr:hypothetical protein HMPREF9946_03138 [Acetobacteraceae bacterium AT-5844]